MEVSYADLFLYIAHQTNIKDDFKISPNNVKLNIDVVTANDSFPNVGLRDFNIKTNLWFRGDEPSYLGSKPDPIISQVGLKQLINEPSHFVADYSSCIV